MAARAGAAVQPSRRGRGGGRRGVQAAPGAAARVGARHQVARLGRAPPRRVPRRRFRQGQHAHAPLRARDLAAARRSVRPVPRDVPARCARHLQQLRRSAWFHCSYQSNLGDFFGQVLDVNRIDLSVGVEGLTQYDPDGVDARAIEAAIEGVHVIRHGKCRFATWLSCLSLEIYPIAQRSSAR